MNEFDEIKDFGTKKTGMKVPDNYFEDFTARMNALIDEEDAKEEETSTPKIEMQPQMPYSEANDQIEDQSKEGKKVSFNSVLSKVKPFMYMAAMYIALFICFKFFIKETTNQELRVDNEIFAEEQYIIEDQMYASMNDYDIMEYLYANAE